MAVMPENLDTVRGRKLERPRIEILSPREGDVLVRGSSHTLRWRCAWPSPPSDLHIVLVQDLKRSDYIYPILDAGEAPAPPKELFSLHEWELEFSVPVDLPSADDFYLEIVSVRTKATGRSDGHLTIISQEGQVDESDVGVWCVCGLTRCNTDKASMGDYVQCDTCGAWLHARCEEVVFDPDDEDADYVCPWCAARSYPSKKLAMTMLKMLLGLSNYSRRLGIDTWEGFCCSPPSVGRFLSRLILRTDQRCIDLGAGTGSLSTALPEGSRCIEMRAERAKVGYERLQHHEWLVGDYLTEDFIVNARGGYDVVISNPDFEVAMPTLYVALLALDGSNPDARCIFLLPSNFFESTPARARMFKVLDVHIETEYRLGCLSYLLTMPGQDKKTPDSLFVFRPGRKDKYVHVSINAKLAGLM